MDAPSLTAAVRRELLAHPDAVESEHRFGGVAFHVGGVEIGHLHGETEADLPLPQRVRAELAAAGRIAPHYAGAESSFVTRRVASPQDVAEIVELFAISYEHAVVQAAADAERQAALDAARPPEPEQRSGWTLPSRPLSRLLRRSR